MYREKGTRPITRASVNSRSQMRAVKDRKDWDDRFSIERMPEYNALRDRHCAAYVNLIKKKFKKPKKITAHIEMGPGRIRKRKIRNPEDIREERSQSRRGGKKPPKASLKMTRAPITDEIMEDLENELNKLWQDHSIPQYHKDVFQQYLHLLSRDASAAMMAKEIDDLKKNKAPIQKTCLGVIARENCLKEIKQYEYQEGEDLDDFITK